MCIRDSNILAIWNRVASGCMGIQRCRHAQVRASPDRLRFPDVIIPIVIGVGALLAGSATGPIVFEEIAERSGLTFVSDSSPTPNKNQPETMVAGVALFDYDNDGYLDVYLVNGAAIPSLTKDSPKYWNRLYHNNHDGTFTDVTEKAGVAGEGYGMGVAIGDYDNDGWPDIYVLNTGKNQLFHNNGNGTFTDVTDKTLSLIHI